MVQKRPFDDEELYQVSSKHPRQLERSHQLVSILEFVPSEDAPRQLQTSGEGAVEFTKIKVGDEKLTSDIIPELLIKSEKDIESGVPRCISISSSAINSTGEENVSSEAAVHVFPGCISISSSAIHSTGEEDVRSEAPVHVLFSPDYFYPDRPIRTLARSEICSSLLEYPPRKSVPIGPDYQANIPAWDQKGSKNTSNYSDTSEAVIFFPQVSDSDLNVAADDDEKKFLGTCVLPMPESEPPINNSNEVGNGRTDCSCHDGGSFRCVRQHIMEARERLRRILGQEIFVGLGFCEMGEEVSEKWSDEEEHLFHEVVFSNPARLGKNFWDYLSIVFPFRTKRDIVSYYFNVFMLRRRAEQNRCVPMNIDSDDDEWQERDDYGDDEPSMTEEDEDSNQSQEDDLHEYHENVADEICDNNENLNFSTSRGIKNFSEKCLGRLHNAYSADPTFQLLNKTPWNESGDHEVQDDSCTSSDTGGGSQETQMKADNHDHWPGSFNELSDGHEYVLGPCDTKVWDGGYMTCPKNEVDFLPTCSMIEEVFGSEAWNYKAGDGKDFS